MALLIIDLGSCWFGVRRMSVKSVLTSVMANYDGVYREGQIGIEIQLYLKIMHCFNVT